MSDGCLFCNHKTSFHDWQILLEGDYFYAFAPKGQIVEGHIIISPYSCNPENGGYRSLSEITSEKVWFELNHFKKIILDFYKCFYNENSYIFYENGRAGGCIVMDPAKKYCYHAHLCSFPVKTKLNAHIELSYDFSDIRDISVISNYNGGGSYIYTHDENTQRIYFVGDDLIIERGMIRKFIAEENSVPKRYDWRIYEGTCEMKKTAIKFKEFYANLNKTTLR